MNLEVLTAVSMNIWLSDIPCHDSSSYLEKPVCSVSSVYAHYFSDTSRECSSVKSDVGSVTVVGTVDTGAFLAT